jgi:hypothetical protein
MMTNYIKFQHLFTAIIAGPTGCGKTDFIIKLNEKQNDIIVPNPTKIYYFYTIWQDKFNILKQKVPEIVFNEGFIDVADIDEKNTNLLILDDLMRVATDNNNVMDIFTKGSHHKNISVILITQNLFSKGRYTRTLSLNSHYIVLFKNPRDVTQISFLARQMYPKKSKFLEDSYNDATKEPHGYLFIDLKQSTPNEYRIQTNIFSTKDHYFYINKN